MTSPSEFSASARRYSDEVILCLEAAPGEYAFFNNARELLGISPSPDVRPWLPKAQELIARRRRETRVASIKPNLNEFLGDL